MCGTCGCGLPDENTDKTAGHQHETESRRVAVELDLLARNNALAERNRQFFDARNILALNLVSSPGAGKTSLLLATINRLKGRIQLSVIEGDQQTALDAERIRQSCQHVHQINTGKMCHLDAHMVGHALGHLQPPPDSLLFIENIGNLVCPAAFALGEHLRVVMLSTPEGEDKPLKYPDMFVSADCVLITKNDLLPYVPFDIQACRETLSRFSSEMPVFEVSAETGDGMDQWLGWLKHQYPGISRPHCSVSN
jgi:hydrogenase nickel incorporation protein HypB